MLICLGRIDSCFAASPPVILIRLEASSFIQNSVLTIGGDLQRIKSMFK